MITGVIHIYSRIYDCYLWINVVLTEANHSLGVNKMIKHG